MCWTLTDAPAWAKKTFISGCHVLRAKLKKVWSAAMGREGVKTDDRVMLSISSTQPSNPSPSHPPSHLFPHQICHKWWAQQPHWWHTGRQSSERAKCSQDEKEPQEEGETAEGRRWGRGSPCLEPIFSCSPKPEWGDISWRSCGHGKLTLEHSSVSPCTAQGTEKPQMKEWI